MGKNGQSIALLALLVLVAVPATAQMTWEQIDAREADEAFLREAEIVSDEKMPQSEGVTEPYKLELSKDGRSEHALWKNPQGRVNGFVEGWKYEIAAYELDKYLGANMVPPTVERRLRGSLGSTQLWLDVWIDFDQMTQKKIDPPGNKIDNFNKRVYLQRAFDNLIANEDRHLRNILLTEDWRMILIDHSRSFRFSKKHRTRLIFTEKHREGPKPMKRLPRAFIEKIKAIDLELLNELVGDYLIEEEITAILDRKALILAEIDRLIEEHGERSTLY